MEIKKPSLWLQITIGINLYLSFILTENRNVNSKIWIMALSF